MTLTETKITNEILFEAAERIFAKFSYMSVGTGTTSFIDSSTDLNLPVQINASDFRKLRVNAPTGSFRNGRDMIMLFNLDPDEPVVQPVNVGEIGLFKTSGTTPDMGAGAKLSVAQTKDTTLKQRWRFSLRVNRVGE